MRVPGLLLLATVAGPLVPANGGAQSQPCPADAAVQRVMITISEAESWDRPLTVRIRQPYSADQPAHPVPDQFLWTLDLRRPARISSVSLLPVKTGYIAVPTEGPWAEMQGTRCVGHLGFRFQQVWRVQVESDPEDLPVQVVAANGVLAERTSFTTAPLPLAGSLHLRISGLGNDTLPLTLRAEQFRNGGEIRHDNRGIKRLLCGATPRSNPNSCTFRYRSVKTREILIRLVEQ